MILDRIGQDSMKRTMEMWPNRKSLALALLTCLAGCGGDPGKGVYPVRGRVLYNGRPAANAQVTFHPVGDIKRDTIRPVGKVDEQGNFTLTSFKDGDGASAGEYQVTVVWFLAKPVRPGSEETVSANYLPVKYASVETSQIKATVTPGSNELQTFDLK
jgi:hypothetical protein